jgi:outer membrane receptor for ferrienterochelin and colicin
MFKSRAVAVGAHANKENLPPKRKEVNLQKGSTSVLGVRGVKSQPPIILVQGRRWSKNVYINARAAGLCVDKAWLEAFV